MKKSHWRNPFLPGVLLLLCLATSAGADPTPLTSNRHIFFNVANPSGVRFDLDGAKYGGPANTYYIKGDGGGTNADWLAPTAADTTKVATVIPVSGTSPSGTLYFNDAGGRGFSDDILLLLSVRGPIPDDFSVHIKASGYTWTPATPGIYNPAKPTANSTGNIGTATFPLADGSLNGLPTQGVNLAYQPVTVDETYTKANFLYGPQTARPGPGTLGTWSLPLYPGQNIADTSTSEYLMFIDLKAGAMRDTNLTDNGAVRIDYSFNNLQSDASFNEYAWVAAANQGEGISFVNPSTNGYTLSYGGAPVAGASYSGTGPYKAGSNVTVTATFSKPVADSPIPTITLSGADSLTAEMTKIDATHYSYGYTAGTGEGPVSVSFSATDTSSSSQLTYTPITGGTFALNKNTATVNLGNLTFNYDGTPKAVTATTVPAGLNVVVSYAGSTTAPSAVGSYAVAATVDDPNYKGSATGTLTITSGTATVNLGSNLTFTYDGTSKAATAVTVPAGLNVGFTYNGSAALPTAAGSYAVVATINDANFHGTGSGTLTINKATPTLTWNTPANMLSSTVLGDGQLNAAAQVPGSFVYSPAAGKMLDPGSQTLTVSFTPSDTANYTTASANVPVTVVAAGNIAGGDTVTLADALLVLQSAMGLRVPTAQEVSRGDVAPLVDGRPAPDGKLDIGDAVVIMRKVVGVTSW